MSITKLNFSITEYYPNTFDFDGYIFHFISDDTKYNDIIDYQERNTITDQIEIKTDLHYCIKAIYDGELIGIANLTIPSSAFYKKVKSLSFPKVTFTISGFTKKKIFSNKENESISVDIKVTFTYIEKQILYKTKSKNYTHAQNSYRSNKNTISSARKRSPYQTPKISNKSLIRQFKSTISTNKYKSAHQSANTSLDYELNSSDSEISIIDSILIDNEYNEEDEKENDEKELEKIRNLLSCSSLLPTDSQLPEKIYKQKDQLLMMQAAYQKKIIELVEIHDKLLNSYKNYNDKLRTLKKKINKCSEAKEKADIKSKIFVNVNRNSNKYIKSLIDCKKAESNLIELIMNTFNKKCKVNDIEDKDILLKVLKRALDLKVDLSSCFNKEGIAKFKSICEKYNLIDNITNNQIKEEDEFEHDSLES